MHCTSCCKIFLPFHCAEGSYELVCFISSHYGNHTLPCANNMGVMFVLRASAILSLLLLLIHLCAYLLVKLFIILNRRAAYQSYVEAQGEKDPVLVGVEECSVDGDLAAEVILGGEGLLSLDKGASGGDDIDTQLADQDSADCKDQVSLEAEDTFRSESAYDSPVEETLEFECHGDHILKTDAAADCPIASSSSCDNGTFQEQEVEVVGRSEENIKEGGKYKSRLDDFNVDKENNDMGGSLAGESTSKSSVEWRGSTICRDSETEYPFSSSSRRSSSHWESYAVFRKYDEEMLYFDKISEQKLTETESFRSIKARSRSISRRILGKFTISNKRNTTGGCWQQGGRDPHHELESAYVAQVCLTWEALNWNYNNFRRAGMSSETGCPAVVAQQFQQFQVLLQRFIENEPYERGPRPEVFARVRITSPKLLLVPEFHDDDDDDGGSKVGILDKSRISSSEFMAILEDAIRTFMSFLRADKDKCCQKLRAFILKRKRISSVDPTFVHLLKKINKKKKLRVKELSGRRSFMMSKKKKLNEDKELEILMALIDMKVVSRVLRMPGITEQQLHWCEEKMSKVRVWDGRMQRDSLPLLFFPAH